MLQRRAPGCRPSRHRHRSGLVDPTAGRRSPALEQLDLVQWLTEPDGTSTAASTSASRTSTCTSSARLPRAVRLAMFRDWLIAHPEDRRLYATPSAPTPRLPGSGRHRDAGRAALQPDQGAGRPRRSTSGCSGPRAWMTSSTASVRIVGGPGRGLRAPPGPRARPARAARPPRAARRACPTRSPTNPSSGGPARNAAYPIVETTLTRAAARAGSSAAALIPTGKPSEAPSAPEHDADAPRAPGGRPHDEQHADPGGRHRRPQDGGAPEARRAGGCRRSGRAVIAATKSPKPATPTACETPYPSTRATASQSLAVPSVMARAEHHDADEQGPRLEPGAGGGRPRRLLDLRDRQERPGAAPDDHRRDARTTATRCGRGRHVEGDQAGAEQRADDRAQAEARVEARHHRAAEACARPRRPRRSWRRPRPRCRRRRRTARRR